MAKRVTDTDIKEMFEIYGTCGNYNMVAEKTGWSVSTVRKYLTMEHPFDTVPNSTVIEVPTLSEIIKKMTGKD